MNQNVFRCAVSYTTVVYEPNFAYGRLPCVQDETVPKRHGAPLPEFLVDRCCDVPRRAVALLHARGAHVVQLPVTDDSPGVRGGAPR